MALVLNDTDQAALAAKRRVRESIIVDRPADLRLNNLFDLDIGTFSPYDKYEIGKFHNLDSIRLQWISPDYFVFIPKKEKKFQYERATGEKITPLRMFTDGGSIPSSLQFLGGLTSWGYAPAYLVHDWLFDLHHCNKTEYSFNDTRDILMEAIKTMMEEGFCPKSDSSFLAIYSGVSSYIAKQIWNKQVSTCPLPPNIEE